jgi:hypothetical protein
VNSGLAIAFGNSAKTTASGIPNDLKTVDFGSGSLDDLTFEAFVQEDIVSSFGAGVYARLPTIRNNDRGLQIIPVKITNIIGGKIVKADELAVPAGGIVQADGAAMIFPTDIHSGLKGRVLFVQVRCDLVRDVTYRLAVDGEFLTATLPTGDQIPGGTFWSWLTVED